MKKALQPEDLKFLQEIKSLESNLSKYINVKES